MAWRYLSSLFPVHSLGSIVREVSKSSLLGVCTGFIILWTSKVSVFVKESDRSDLLVLSVSFGELVGLQ